MGGWARAALIADEDGQRALKQAVAAAAEPGAPPTALALLFASPAYGSELPRLVRMAYRETGASGLVGCSGQGVLGTSREREGGPPLSLLRLPLPGARVASAHVTQSALAAVGPLGALGADA